MKLRKLLTIVGLLLGLTFYTQAQVTVSPATPTIDDEITLVYDASQGTSGLQGANKVYMHSSVGTNSNGETWTDDFTVGNWGQDDGVGEMTKRSDLGTDMWSITLTPRTYYNIPAEVTVYNLAMVFRSADGSQEGKNDSNGNIYLTIDPGVLTVFFNKPNQELITPAVGETIDIEVASFQVADRIELLDGGVQIAEVTNADKLETSIVANSTERREVKAILYKGTETVSTSFFYFSITPKIANVPAGLKEGINYISGDSLVLNLYAPSKSSAFLLGDWNDWQIDPTWQLSQSEDGDYFWIGVGGLTAGQEYNFQYVVDGGIRISDPYAEKVVYEYDKDQIPNSVYPDELLSYPNGKTYGPVAVMQPGKTPYPWKVTDFQAPDRSNLVIYELLIRDFALEESNQEIGTYQAVLDSLPYLMAMGVNAIEFMPVNEFPGQNSWGYNPAHFTALEKGYGLPEKFKELVDACHENGIAVILDVVFNHTQEDNPIAQLFWDSQNFRPAADSPWLNQSPTHPFNVFFDFNHESPATKKFVDIVTQYWLDEYKIDGFRFDLSKGFTQVNNINDVGAWSRRDDSRIAIIKEMTDKIWTKHPDTYVILEHFADNEEETILANYTNADQTNSIMLWGNMHGSFETNIKGNSGSNIDWASHTTRGWNQPGVVAFMESHDEERQMYAALNSGNSTGGANTLPVAAKRIAAANALLYTIPGPKMLWQFGELGYDYSINYCINTGTNGDCRIDRKPIRWDYTEEEARWELYQTTAEIIKLRTKYNVFQTNNVTIGGGNRAIKYVKLINENFVENPTTTDQMNVITVANLSVASGQVTPEFPHTGTWYNYFTGETLEVTDINQSIPMLRSTFAIYTDVRINDPVVSSAEDELLRAAIKLFPNPAQEQLQVSLENEVKGNVELRVVDLLGKEITSVKAQKKATQLSQSIDIAHLPSGMYILQIITSEGKAGKPFFKQ